MANASQGSKWTSKMILGASTLGVLLVITVIAGGIFFWANSSLARAASAKPSFGGDRLKEVFSAVAQGDQAGYRPHFGPLTAEDHERLQAFSKSVQGRYGQFLGSSPLMYERVTRNSAGEVSYHYNLSFATGDRTAVVSYSEQGEPLSALWSNDIVAIQIKDPTNGNLTFP